MSITTNIRDSIKGIEFERLIVAGESPDIVSKALDKLIAFYCDKIDAEYEDVFNEKTNRIEELEGILRVEEAFNVPVSGYLRAVVDAMKAGMSVEEIRACACLTTRHGDLSTYIDKLKADLEAREGWIELPKDKSGATLDPKDQPLMTPRGLSCAWSIDYDDGEWTIAYSLPNGESYGAYTQECELVKSPYDKTGRTIEAGMCLVMNPFPLWKITAVREEEGCPGIWHLFRKNKDGNDVFLYAWCSENANRFEIVPEPDTQEKIDADTTLHPVDYAFRVLKWDTQKIEACDASMLIEAMCRDLLRRQRVLDGVE